MQKLAGWAKRKKLAQWTKRVLVISGGSALVAGAISLLLYKPNWTGFGSDSTKNIERDSVGKVTKIVEVEQSGKTLWDWLTVLGVPLSLAVLGFWLQRHEQKRVGEQTKLERELAEGNQREEALQVYFDRLSTLLIDKNLIAIAAKVKNADKGEENQHNTAIEEDKELLNAAVDVIQARTLSILRQFGEDGERKSSVIQFLLEAEVIDKLNLNLSRANLSGINLSGADFSGANLSRANLRGADLDDANLSGANLFGANLSGANLRLVNFSGADLSGADFSGANLCLADFSSANLIYANLSGANLSVANLTDAKWLKIEQLDQAKLCETKLPEEFKLDSNRDCKELEFYE